MEQFPDEKDKQIEFVRSGIMGRDVYLIMDVFGNKPGRDDKRYITGSCSFIMEVIPDAAQGTLQVEEEPQPSYSTPSSEHVENPYVEALVQACVPLDQDPKWIPVAKAREIASIGADISDNLVQEMTKRASQVWNERKKV